MAFKKLAYWVWPIGFSIMMPWHVCGLLLSVVLLSEIIDWFMP